MNNQTVLLAGAQKSLYLFAAFAQTILAPETPFARLWVNRSVHYQLRKMEEGEHPRLLLNVPNGYHNRILISTARVAWKLGQNPNQRFLIILPRADDAYLNIEQMMAELNKLFKANFYPAIFPYIAPRQISAREIQTGDNGRIYVTRACERLPTYPVDHIISLDAEYDYRLDGAPSTSQEAEWLINAAFKKLNSTTHSSITVLNKRVSWVDISTLLTSGDHGDWKHLEIQHQSDGANTYQIKRNGKNRAYTTEDGEALPEDPEEHNPSYENKLQNMAFHGLLFSANDEMPGMWKLFQNK